MFTNAVGARLTVTDEVRSFGKICSHILTGYEQFAIREVCELVNGLQAIIYDGFIAPPQPTAPLEQKLRERSEEVLGLPLDLRFKIQDMSEPIPEPEPDPLLESIARGQTQYSQWCVVCHAGDGSGISGPDLRDSNFNTFAALRSQIDDEMPFGNSTACRDSGSSTCATDVANFVIAEFQ